MSGSADLDAQLELQVAQHLLDGALDLLSGEGFAYADPDGLIVSVPPETAYILRCVNAAD